MSMGTWKKKIIRKQGKGNQTTGKSKGIISSALFRYICRRNRSYKHPEYARLMALYNGNKVRKGKG